MVQELKSKKMKVNLNLLTLLLQSIRMYVLCKSCALYCKVYIVHLVIGAVQSLKGIPTFKRHKNTVQGGIRNNMDKPKGVCYRYPYTQNPSFNLYPTYQHNSIVKQNGTQQSQVIVTTILFLLLKNPNDRNVCIHPLTRLRVTRVILLLPRRISYVIHEGVNQNCIMHFRMSNSLKQFLNLALPYHVCNPFLMFE